MDSIIIIDKILIPSLQRLYKIDYNNIKFGVSERNICARLALHIENVMREYDELLVVKCFQNYFVDVEYNRMVNGNLKHYENSQHRPQYMVSDLLIQSRGYERNLLAVEMKRKNNYRGVKTDKERLLSLVSLGNPDFIDKCVYETQVGAFIKFSPETVKIEIYECINGLPAETQELQYMYSENSRENPLLLLDKITFDKYRPYGRF